MILHKQNNLAGVCEQYVKAIKVTHATALQHIATQHSAIHCNTLQYIAIHGNTLQRTATHCDTLQRTATTLQYTQQNKRAGAHKQYYSFKDLHTDICI